MFLSGFLRYLLQCGTLAIDLAQAVPAPARRHLSGLPKFMPAEDVERLLASVDRTRPQGLRDEAILLLLARLGLRAGEVARLRLEDLDWEAGELNIRGKRGRVKRLPLPWDVGEALGRHLRDARPACTTRQVFVCLRAPRGFLDGQAVGTIVRRALARADRHAASGSPPAPALAGHPVTARGCIPGRNRRAAVVARFISPAGSRIDSRGMLAAFPH